MKFGITVHTIVKNEEKFIKDSLLSVIEHVDRILVWDTGSTDKTVSEITSIKNNKIELKEMGKVDRKSLVKLRNEQIKQTKTPWFLILDGDEIWPKKNIIKLIQAMKAASPETKALVNKTRNCIGDIYHYLPEEKGKYKIGPWQGHLNIRAIKNIPGLKVIGEYPQEAFMIDGLPIQNLVKHLEFVDTWYLHATHLQRSSWFNQLNVIDRIKKYKFIGKGIKLPESQLPEVLRK